MVKRSLLIAAFFLVPGFGSFATNAAAQSHALAPDFDAAVAPANEQDKNKSVDDLIAEAQELFLTRQPIDARAKLQRALALAPNDYRPYLFLGQYYLAEVAHFQLAYRYLKTAEKLFKANFIKTPEGLPDPEHLQHHARLLFLISESELNLDRYEDSLKTLDEYGKFYMADWYPGTRAWVLMKLKRVDEAIRVAQMGLLSGAEPTRTYNILGILLSLKDNRALALQAFARAIRAEMALGGLGQAATPLNNSGEVYRELFRDREAEAAWTQAVKMPDGCDHILPSLNLAILYIDELRLFQAERALQDFEACFANKALRQDSEHRALLALARGRIAMRRGDIERANAQLAQAMDREQWFGKIGTDPNDLRFAATLTNAQALEAQSEVLKDRALESIWSNIPNEMNVVGLKLRAWWLRRRAREIALDHLEDLEDLQIRHTDAMLEYPTLGQILRDFPTEALRRRLERLKSTDKRENASAYYDLYLATNLIEHGHSDEAVKLLEKAQAGFRRFDRSAQAEALVQLIKAKTKLLPYFGASAEQKTELERLREQLFELLPAAIRINGFSLPIGAQKNLSGDEGDVQDILPKKRFEESSGGRARYRLEIGAGPSLSLVDTTLGQPLVSVRREKAEETLPALVNRFVDKVFSHRIDPAAEALPKLEILPWDSAE